MSKNKPTIITDFPMAVPALKLNEAHRKITNLQRTAEKACEYVMELDNVYYQCPWAAERWEKTKRCFGDCRPKGDKVQEKECWLLYFKELAEEER